MIGPNDHGRKMSLRDYEFVETKEGFHYELGRGYIVVTEFPSYFHILQVDAVRTFLSDYRHGHAEAIHAVFGPTDCKILIPDWESERHPDLSIYLSRPHGKKDRRMWRTWLPDLTIEVVSPSSLDRDYVEKRDEYWSLGIKEYWIVDAARGKVTQLRRGKADWIARELHADDFCETKLLPGFKMPCRAIFEVAAGQEDDE